MSKYLKMNIKRTPGSEWESIEIDPNLRGMVVLNLQSYGGTWRNHAFFVLPPSMFIAILQRTGGNIRWSRRVRERMEVFGVVGFRLHTSVLTAPPAQLPR